MFVLDEARECRHCGCSDFPFYMEIRKEKAVISYKCLLCFREDDAQKAREYYQRHKEQCKKSSAERKKRNRKRYNLLSRKYYAKESNEKRFKRRERMANWYLKTKAKKSSQFIKRKLIIPSEQHPWKQLGDFSNERSKIQNYAAY